MVSRDKVKLMTKAAIFERHERLKALETSRYRKNDYITLHVISIWLAAVTAGGLAICLLISYQAVNGTSQTAFQFSNIGLWIALVLAFLVFISLVYVNIAYQYYLKRYNRDLKKFQEYEGIIQQLNQFYEREKK